MPSTEAISTAKYTSGSITRHLIIMAGSAATGLMVMFLSDLVDMYFLGLLGEVEIAAAVGYAWSILFFSISINLGLAIACSALVSRHIGANDLAQTRTTVTHCLFSSLALTVPLCLLLWLFTPQLLQLLGADGYALDLADAYISIIILSMPLLALSMSCGGIMRAQGDAKGAMWITMIGGIVNVVLDPIFIFGFNWGIEGAALASVCSRIAMVAYGYYVIVHRGQWLGALRFDCYLKDVSNYLKIALPAVLTNLSTPIGIAYVTYAMAQFGDSAVAGNAIISRIQPVAFAGVFALSGIVGPIAGQNFGAKKMDRVYATLKASLRLLLIYCLLVSGLLGLFQGSLVPLFNASDKANELVFLFCSGLSLMFVFNGVTFITNALFNNLGAAHYATVMNLGKATVGTIPFVLAGAYLGGPAGILWGLLIGSGVMAGLGLWLSCWLLQGLEQRLNTEAALTIPESAP